MDFTHVGTTFLGSILGVVGTYFAQRSAAVHPLQVENATLKATHAAQQKILSDALAENQKLQAKNAELQTYIDQQFSRQSTLAKYTVDEPTADLVANGIHFCSPCFHKSTDPLMEIQMKKLPNGKWQCPVCGKPRRNVSFPTRSSTPIRFD